MLAGVCPISTWAQLLVSLVSLTTKFFPSFFCSRTMQSPSDFESRRGFIQAWSVNGHLPLKSSVIRPPTQCLHFQHAAHSWGVSYERTAALCPYCQYFSCLACESYHQPSLRLLTQWCATTMGIPGWSTLSSKLTDLLFQGWMILIGYIVICRLREEFMEKLKKKTLLVLKKRWNLKLTSECRPLLLAELLGKEAKRQVP